MQYTMEFIALIFDSEKQNNLSDIKTTFKRQLISSIKISIFLSNLIKK